MEREQTTQSEKCQAEPVEADYRCDPPHPSNIPIAIGTG
jgi:hypothetical protein